MLFYYYFVYRNKIDIFILAFICCNFYFITNWIRVITRGVNYKSK